MIYRVKLLANAVREDEENSVESEENQNSSETEAAEEEEGPPKLYEDVEIYSYSPNLSLIEPTVELELNTAGSFEFTMPPGHKYYDYIQFLMSTIEVYEEDDIIWFGRPINIKTDFYKQKQVYCEGALGYLNDTVQRYKEWYDVSLHTFFREIIENHNTYCSEGRGFTVGQITVPDKNVYRKVEYETTLDVLKKMCIDTNGGYFFVRREEGVNYIDWLKEMPYESNQPVEFGLNLLDLATEMKVDDIVTCLIPLGDNITEDTSEYGIIGEPMNIAQVNEWSDTIVMYDLIPQFGRITKVVRFSGAETPADLKAKGEKYLEDNQWDGAVIDCKAAEMHLSNENFNKFKIGQMVHCVSAPHVLDKEFPLMKLSIRLDEASKQITLGTPPKQKFSEIYKQDTTYSAKHQFVTEEIYEEIGAENGYDPDTIYYLPAETEMESQLTPELEQEILDQYDAGTSPAEMVFGTAITLALIYYVLKKFGRILR